MPTQHPAIATFHLDYVWLRLFCEGRLDKVLIECKGCPDAQPLHNEKGDAICEGGIFILMALEIRPGHDTLPMACGCLMMLIIGSSSANR